MFSKQKQLQYKIDWFYLRRLQRDLDMSASQSESLLCQLGNEISTNTIWLSSTFYCHPLHCQQIIILETHNLTLSAFFLSPLPSPTIYANCLNIQPENPKSIHLLYWMGGHSRKLLKLGNSRKAHFLLGLFDEAPLRDYLHSSSLNNASSRFPSLNNSMYTFPLPPPHHPLSPTTHAPILIQTPFKSAARQIPWSDPRGGATLFFIFAISCASNLFSSRFPDSEKIVFPERSYHL